MEQFDNVNNPKHYNREGAMECFDEFVLIYGKEAAKYACLFNIHKYRYRAADKNGEEDLRKSDWYLKKYKELSEGVVISTDYGCTIGNNMALYCSDNKYQE